MYTFKRPQLEAKPQKSLNFNSPAVAICSRHTVKFILTTLTSCAHGDTICPRPSPSPWAPKRLAPASRRQRSSSFPRPTRSHAHRCSRLTRQHGGEQSGLVTLTCDLESGIRVTCDVGYLCANFGLPRPLYSRLRPDVRDRQTDLRQRLRLKPPPIRGGA